jgi:ribosome recycling factor
MLHIRSIPRIRFCDSSVSIWSYKSRLFSWKSRLNRDPELRQKKLESLNKRYTLRRLDVLDGQSIYPQDGSEFFPRVQRSIETILARADSRMSKISNIDELDREEMENIGVGSTPLQAIASIHMSGPRSCTVAVRDRGNIDRVFKALKHAFPHCMCSILGRERVEVKIPPITAELREARGEVAEKCIDEIKKELKKSELLVYREIKTTFHGPSHVTAALVERIKAEFSTANQLVDESLTAAIEKLGLE